MLNVYPIDRNKAEAPLMAVFSILAIILSLFFYPRIGPVSLSIFPLSALVYLICRKSKLEIFRKDYFYYLDETGVKYCTSIFQKPKYIQWNQIHSIYTHLHEINLRLKDTGRVISLPTGVIAGEFKEPFIDRMLELYNSNKENGKTGTAL